MAKTRLKINNSLAKKKKTKRKKKSKEKKKTFTFFLFSKHYTVISSTLFFKRKNNFRKLFSRAFPITCMTLGQGP